MSKIDYPENMLIPYNMATKLQVALMTKDYENPVLQEYIDFVIQKKKNLMRRMMFEKT